MIYLNMKTNYGVETVDQLDPADFSTTKEFKDETSRLVSEYNFAGMAVYKSSRADESWSKE